MVDRYRETSRRRRRRAERSNQRLDIQGLRTVAVLAVVAHHLWGWPRGGSVGIDVFFVVSGFLVTGSLLLTSKHAGTPSLTEFYWNRVRRILPAAAVVLLGTCVASLLILTPARARDTLVDALFAFAGVANWHATAGDSPVAHFWALSIAEQFYVVWPLLILAVGALVARERTRAVAVTAAVVVAASFAWALYREAPLDTLTRVWELGVGALLATAAAQLSRIPQPTKPLLSWAGVLLIGASLALAGDTAAWALLPVAGTALVLAAGVGGESGFQPLLCNRVSTYVGDLSYPLYLAHWPVIVLVGALMERSPYFYVCVLAFTFGVAVACHHFVENPSRHASRDAFRQAIKDMERGLFHVERRTKAAAVGALVLIAVGLCAFAARPDAYEPTQQPVTQGL
ncbi:acyltransferase family protein [Mycolicibacterium litorale]|uniref:acyltransferase family protein n=1 Tax=Mycolicibacterium litorale TaxID=758802 RepID=UPI003CF7836B